MNDILVTELSGARIVSLSDNDRVLGVDLFVLGVESWWITLSGVERVSIGPDLVNLRFDADDAGREILRRWLDLGCVFDVAITLEGSGSDCWLHSATLVCGDEQLEFSR